MPDDDDTYPFPALRARIAQLHAEGREAEREAAASLGDAGHEAMTDKYEGPIGPTNAMNALAPEFGDAYASAIDKIMAAVLEFERITGRVVDGLGLNRLDVTTIRSPTRQSIRQVEMRFQPNPSEVAW